MKIFVTGVSGQLGHDVMNELSARGHEGIGSDIWPDYPGVPGGDPARGMGYVSLDITDGAAVRETLLSVKPDAVIHCAAWTDVDGAEDAANQDRVYAVNVRGTRHIAKACSEIGAKLMYISTDYVFNGCGDVPWSPDCSEFAPLNAYGRTKLKGELAISEFVKEKYFVVRTSWAFGVSGNNFIKTMLKLGKSHDTLRVVNDQIGTPTFTRDLARLLVDMIETEKYGYYHATNEGGYISWAQFAAEIFRQAGMNVTVIPVTTVEYGISKAARPFNSRLDKRKLVENGFEPLPDWKDAVGRYLKAAAAVDA